MNPRRTRFAIMLAVFLAGCGDDPVAPRPLRVPPPIHPMSTWELSYFDGSPSALMKCMSINEDCAVDDLDMPDGWSEPVPLGDFGDSMCYPAGPTCNLRRMDKIEWENVHREIWSNLGYASQTCVELQQWLDRAVHAGRIEVYSEGDKNFGTSWNSTRRIGVNPAQDIHYDPEQGLVQVHKQSFAMHPYYGDSNLRMTLYHEAAHEYLRMIDPWVSDYEAENMAHICVFGTQAPLTRPQQ